MGWTSYSMRRPIKEWFKDQWEQGGKYEVLDSALVSFHVMYGAIKEKETGEVFAAVFLIQWSKGYYNFSYKDMTEFAGPVEHQCPKRIMKLLTPLETNDDNLWAIRWRERVNSYHRMNDTLKKPNTTIKMNKPVSFNSGIKFNHFKKEGKKIFAGEIQKNGVFAKFTQVKLDLLYYMRNYGYEFVECS